MKEIFERKIEELEREVAYHHEQLTKATAKLDLLHELIGEENAFFSATDTETNEETTEATGEELAPDPMASSVF